MSLLKPIHNPVDGSMHVVGCTAINPNELAAPCHITYVVQAPGVPAFSGDDTYEVWTRNWPQPGDDLPVTFDRDHPDRIEIHWDQVPATSDSARADADAMAAELRGEAAGPASSARAPSSPAAPPADATDDVISELERLGKLRDDGVLTPEEFAAQKQRVLGASGLGGA
jgi:hypothetical protein